MHASDNETVINNGKASSERNNKGGKNEGESRNKLESMKNVMSK